MTEPAVPEVIPPQADWLDLALGAAYAQGSAQGRTLPPGNGPIRAVIQVTGFRPRRHEAIGR